MIRSCELGINAGRKDELGSKTSMDGYWVMTRERKIDMVVGFEG